MIGQMQEFIFFNKLASLGIQVENEEDGRRYLAVGNAMLQQHPIQTMGRNVKQACADAFGTNGQVSEQGFSADAHQVAEYVFASCPDLVKAAEFLVSQSQQ